MYSKVVQPDKDGSKAYNNKGSSLRLGNYLVKELKEELTEEELSSTKYFFNSEGDFTKDEMVSMLDNNVKGLTADDDKFYSLVLSPSKEELEHIGNDPEKLKDFSIACMENYAENFKIKSRSGEVKTLSEKDMIWFANIEFDRTYKGHDEAVKNGEKKQGERKDGLQTHIHITVSARDKSQKITLNPQTKDKNRFSIITWSKENAQTFNEKFNYKGVEKVSLKSESKEAWNKVMAVERKLTTFEKKYHLPESDSIAIRSLAVEKDYSQDFRNKLAEIGTQLKEKGGKDGLNEDQNNLLLSSKIDDRSPTGRLERQLERITKNVDLSEEQQERIKEIAEDKNYSSDFFNKLYDFEKLTKEVEKDIVEDNLSVSVIEFSESIESELLSSIKDDGTKETRLALKLKILEHNYQLTDNESNAIAEIGKMKNYSASFFNRLIIVEQGFLANKKTEPIFVLDNERQNLLENAITNDSTKEVRLEIVLDKFKLNYQISEEIEKSIRAAATETNLSSSFFNRLNHIEVEFSDNKKGGVEKAETFSEKQNDLLSNAIKDDGTKEVRLEMVLDKFKLNYQISEEIEKSIRATATETNLSASFFNRLNHIEVEFSDNKKGGVEKAETFSEKQNDLLSNAIKDDGTKEVRLEMVLDKFKLNYQISEEIEKSIRATATETNLSSSFFNRLSHIEVEFSDNKKGGVEKAETFSEKQNDLLSNAIKDDGTKEVRLEMVLDKFKLNYQISEEIEKSIRDRATETNLSSSFFNRLNHIEVEFSDNKKGGVEKAETFSEKQNDLLSNAIKDDGTKEVRLEIVLDKFKLNYQISEEIEKSIRAAATETNLSSSFFNRLNHIEVEFSDNKKGGVEKAETFSEKQNDLFSNAIKDDGKPETRLEIQLDKFSLNYNLSEDSQNIIREIGKDKGFSKDFFEKLYEIDQEFKEEKASSPTDVQQDKRELTDKHIDSLNSAEAFELQQSSFLQDFTKAYHFFKGADTELNEDEMQDIFKKANKKFKIKRGAKQVQQSQNNEMSM